MHIRLLFHVNTSIQLHRFSTSHLPPLLHVIIEFKSQKCHTTNQSCHFQPPSNLRDIPLPLETVSVVKYSSNGEAQFQFLFLFEFRFSFSVFVIRCSSARFSTFKLSKSQHQLQLQRHHSTDTRRCPGNILHSVQRECEVPEVRVQRGQGSE